MPDYQPTDRPSRTLVSPWVAAALLIVAIFLVVRGIFNIGGRPMLDPDYEARPVTARGDLAEDESATIELFRQVSPSVVYITTATVRGYSFNLFEIPQGTGSGFIYDKRGHVVTNFHVIQNANAANVTLSDQSTWSARLVGAEPDQDLAVLRIDAPSDRLQPILIGTASDLQVGQKVFAIGNPFGFDQTLTTGVVSGLGREITSVTKRKITGVIQTDAAINPGNSGGPLLDSAGRLVGVNTAIFSRSGDYAGIGFAVPADTANRVVPELIRYGRIERPVLGIGSDDRIPKRLGIDGVLVMRVLSNSGAEKAGLRATGYDENGNVRLGDIIIAANDEPTPNTETLLDILGELSVGDVVKLTVLRDNQQLSIDVTLQAG